LPGRLAQADLPGPVLVMIGHVMGAKNSAPGIRSQYG
jgi:hypothetical protein